jgi:hypothetical protein
MLRVQRHDTCIELRKRLTHVAFPILMENGDAVHNPRLRNARGSRQSQPYYPYLTLSYRDDPL